VWYLNLSGDIKQLESVQCRAARWVCGSQWNPVNRQWSKSSDCCLNLLEWPLLHQRQIYFTICQVHNIIHHLSAIPFMQYFSTDNRHSNPSVLDTSISTINPYRFSFSINSSFLWNKVPPNILQIKDPKRFRAALRQFLFYSTLELTLNILFYRITGLEEFYYLVHYQHKILE